MTTKHQRPDDYPPDDSPHPEPADEAQWETQDWNLRESRQWLWLLGIFVVGLLARLIVVWELRNNNPGFYLPDVDSGWHYLWAKSLAGGNWLGTEVFYRAPLYPYLLALWMKLAGDSLTAIRVVQAVIGAASGCIVALVGGRMFNRHIGLIAGFAWALWGTMIYYETELLIPVLIVPLNLLALWWALGQSRSSRSKLTAWLGIGLILGISAIARPNILITVPVFLWIAWSASREQRVAGQRVSRLSPLVALVLGVLIPILPVTARNCIVAGDPVLIAYQGGVNLYLGNNPQADGLTMIMPEVSLDPTLSWDKFVSTTDSIAQAKSRRALTPSEISSFWTGKAVNYMVGNPGTTLGSWAKKTYYLLNGFEPGDQTDIYGHTQYSQVLQFLIWHAGIYFPFGLVIPLALIGIFLSWRRYPRTRVVAVFIGIYSLSIIGFLVTARHRLPIIPLFVIFAVAAVRILYEGWKRRPAISTIVASVVAVCLLVVLNLPTVARILDNPAYTLYQQALIHDRRGEYTEAIELYGEALNVEPMLLAARRNLALALVRNQEFDLAVTVSFSYLRFKEDDAEAYNNLGLAYLGQTDTSRAMGSFRTANRKNPNLGQPLLNMGDISLAQGESDHAAGFYSLAINADSSFGPAYNALAVLYARGGQLDTAIALLEKCTRRNPDYPSAWANLGNMQLQKGDATGAVYSMKRALALTPNATTIRYNLAAVYARTGETDRAISEVQKLLEIDPQHLAGVQLLESLQKNTPAP